MKRVNDFAVERGVVIYAEGKLYDELKATGQVTAVTAETSHEDLRKMDQKTAGRYPVYMINEDYGTRGLDFRARHIDHGIAQFLCSPFSNYRTRHQCLMRVGRFGDDCTRIQDT